jgi:predicted transporter
MSALTGGHRRIFAIIASFLAVMSLFLLVTGQIASADDGEEDIGELRARAEALVAQGDYGGAAVLYDEIGLWYMHNGDWDSGADCYALSAGCYVEAGQYRQAVDSYALAGDCHYEDKDFDNALVYYQQAQASAEIYQQSTPDYDGSWIDEKITGCQTAAQEAGLMVRLLVMGVLLAVVKFSTKAALGSAYSPVKWKGIFLIASVYLAVGVITGLVFQIVGVTLVSDKIMATLFDYGIVLGVFQVALSLILGVFGFLTINKWKQGKDVSNKTFLAMAIPCPVSVITIITSVASLVVAGVAEVNAGLIVGGVFFISIMGMVFLLRKFKPRRSPIGLGVIMLLFALIYVATILFVPAYLDASTTVIETDFAPGDIVPVLFSLLIVTALGFVLGKLGLTETRAKIKGGS